MGENTKTCLVTKLLGEATGQLPKLGDYTIKLTQMQAGATYTIRVSPDDSNTLTISGDAYFCTNQGASINSDGGGKTAKENSKSITLGSQNLIYIHLDSGNTVNLTISDKYSFHGLGASGYSPAVYYDIPYEDLVFMPKWSAFFRNNTVRNFATYPITRLICTDEGFEGDISDVNLSLEGDGRFLRYIALKNISGQLQNLGPNPSGNDLNISIQGSFSYSINGYAGQNLPANNFELISTEVSGDISNYGAQTNVFTLGDSLHYTSVGVSGSLTAFPAKSRFTLYSNEVTAHGLKLLVDAANTLIASQAGGTAHLNTFVASSIYFTTANIENETGLTAALKALKRDQHMTKLIISDNNNNVIDIDGL